jgi:hypothetical protein
MVDTVVYVVRAVEVKYPTSTESVVLLCAI